MRVLAPLGLILFLAACSETPTATKVVKEPERPPTPITAQQAFQYTYPAARMWAGDSQPVRIRSINLTDVKSEGGKAGAWELTYVSESQQAARVYTWSAVEAPGPLHKGVFAPQPQAWRGSSGQEKPFAASAFHTDTPDALEAAVSDSREYLDKPGAKPGVSFLLEFTPRFPNPAWRVLWGESVGSAEYTVFVDATTGKVVGKG